MVSCRQKGRGVPLGFTADLNSGIVAALIERPWISRVWEIELPLIHERLLIQLPYHNFFFCIRISYGIEI